MLALIGPSGCGKTTLLRSLNRLVEITPTASRGGRISLDGEDIDRMEVTALRRRVSMVFQQPNPFPMSVFDNVAYALREQGSGRPGKEALMRYVGDALVRAGLWDEVGATLDHPALRLSGGQQQRLCIARALAARPEVLLLDEPCSALDPRSTQVIEELILKLREEVAVVIVTHNMQQALRIADHVGFMYLGELVEYGPAEQVFGAPARGAHPRVRGGRVRMMPARRCRLALALAGVALVATGCQSTQDKSAKIAAELGPVKQEKGLKITKREQGRQGRLDDAAHRPRTAAPSSSACATTRPGPGRRADR